MADGREHSMTPGRGPAAGAEMGDAGATNAAVGKRTLTEGAGVGATGAAASAGLSGVSGAGTGSEAAEPIAEPAPGTGPAETSDKKPTISGTIVAGGPLSDADVDAVNIAARSVPKQFRRYVAYAGVIKVGGSLAWRANNPGNLRDADTKIGTVPGAVGSFAVFATMDDGRAAQRSLYINRYGSMTVRAAVNKLTPPSENDTEGYLRQLAAAGIDLDKDVQSQIDPLMAAIEQNEGMITGVEIARSS